MEETHYALLHGGKEVRLIRGEWYGQDIHIPIPLEMKWDAPIVNYKELVPIQYEIYEYRGRMWPNVSVYELKK